VDLARGVGVAHRHRIVDQHQFNPEVLSVRSLPDLAGLEALVGQDDRPPAGPHVQREPHRAVLHLLVGRDALDGGQFFSRLETVFLDRGDAGPVAGLGLLAELRRIDLDVLARRHPGRLSRRRSLGGEDVGPIDREGQQAEDHQTQDCVKRCFGLPCHVLSP